MAGSALPPCGLNESIAWPGKNQRHLKEKSSASRSEPASSMPMIIPCRASPMHSCGKGHPMSRKLNVAMLGVALAIVGCGRSESQKAAEIRPVRTVMVSPQAIQSERTAVGDVRPRYESDLGFRISGKITKRLVDVGASVRKGDLLAQLEDQDYRNKLTSAETEVTGAVAVLAEAEAAEARSRHLLGNGYATRANYDVALKNLRAAEAKLISAN